jgi:hypothetical protein
MDSETLRTSDPPHQHDNNLAMMHNLSVLATDVSNDGAILGHNVTHARRQPQHQERELR